MYRFFETIRYYKGHAENISLHQRRVDQTFSHFGLRDPINLERVIFDAPAKPNLENDVCKCRIHYSLNRDFTIRFEKYSIRVIKNLTLADIGSFTYRFKETDRDWLNNILRQAKSDEVILTQKGIVKDATYANLVFFDGHNWVTPAQPLLFGTRRAQLLEQGIIKQQQIHVEDLRLFQRVKLINAMMRWEESPFILIEKILYQ